MSTYAYAKLIVIDDKKLNIRKIEDVNVNYMKNILFGWDWPEEFDGFNPQLNIDIKNDFLGYIKKECVEDEYVKKHILDINDAIQTITVDEMFDTQQEGKIEQCEKEHDINGCWYAIYRKNSNYSAVWLTEDIISNYCDKLKSIIAESYDEKARLENMKFSISYYQLNDEQKEFLNDDLQECENSIEDLFNKLESCRQLIGLIDGFKELNEKDYSDDVYAALYLC